MTENRSRVGEVMFKGLCFASVLLPLVVLAGLLVSVAVDGIPRIDWDFIQNYPSRRAARAGLRCRAGIFRCT